MTATSNPTAIAKIDAMIANIKMDIEFTEGIIRDAVATVERRVAAVTKGLDENLGIFDPAVTEAALKVDRYVQQRTAQYAQLNALLITRKAAGGE